MHDAVENINYQMIASKPRVGMGRSACSGFTSVQEFVACH